MDSQSEEAGTSLAPPIAHPDTPGPQSPNSTASFDPSSTGLASEVTGPTAGPSNALPTVPVNGKKNEIDVKLKALRHQSISKKCKQNHLLRPTR